MNQNHLLPSTSNVGKNSTSSNTRFRPARGLVLSFGIFLLAAAQAQAQTLWTAISGAAANTNWSVAGNWTPNVVPDASANVLLDDTAAVNGSPFSAVGNGPGGTPARTNFNNVVDASFTIASLTYTNAVTNFQNTLIAPGATLTTSELTVGNYVSQLPTPVNRNNQVVTIAGANASLVVSNTGAVISVMLGTTNVIQPFFGLPGSTLDLSGLDTFTAVVSKFIVAGAKSTGTIMNRPSGVVYLAATNYISAGYQQTIANQDATTAMSEGPFLIGDAAQNGGLRNQLYLGRANTINADTFFTSRQKSTNGLIRFNPSFLTGGQAFAIFRGFTGSKILLWCIANGVSNSGTTDPRGTNDFSGGAVDILVSTMSLGKAGNANSGAGTATGSLIFDKGVVNADNLIVGLGPQVAGGSGTKGGVGTVNVNSNATLFSAANLIVNSNLSLGVTLGVANNSSGTLSINGGNAQVNNFIIGTGITSVNITNGTLAVTNTLGTTGAKLRTLRLNNGNLKFAVTAGGASAVVSNLVINGASDIINIVSVPEAYGLPAQYPVISYTTLTGVSDFTLGTLAGTNSGYLSNNVANASIDLVIPSIYPVAPRITSIGGCSGTVELSWSTPVPNVTGYIVKRSTTSGAETNYVTTTATNFVDVNVTGGITYYYQITATNNLGIANSLESSVTVVGGSPVTISTQPVSQSYCSNSMVTLFVNIAGGSGIEYTWQTSTNSGSTWNDISGATASIYTTDSLTAADNGRLYRVLVSSSCNWVASIPAKVSIITGTIAIPALGQPFDQYVTTNWGAAFIIQASGPVTSYQWRKDGVNLVNSANVSGVSTSVLKLSNLTLADSASVYDCVLNAGACNALTSSGAVLTVVPDSQELQFGFEEDGDVYAYDSITGLQLDLASYVAIFGDLHGPAGSGVAGIGKALDLTSSTNGLGGAMAIQDSVSASFRSGVTKIGSFTISMWIKPATNLFIGTTFPRFFFLGNRTNASDSALVNTIGLTGNGNNFLPLNSVDSVEGKVNTMVTSFGLFGALPMPTNKWSFLVLTYDGATLNFYGGYENTPVTLRSTTNFPAGFVDVGNGYKVTLGNRLDYQRSFKGQMDDVRFYLGAAPQNVLESIRQQASPLTTPAAPIMASASVSGGTMNLAVNTEAGFQYILQSTPSLTPPVVWTPVSTNAGTGAPLTNSVSVTANTNQFFRYVVP